MSLEVFANTRSPISRRIPMARLDRNGLYFNSSAVKLFSASNVSRVLILWDAETRKIGLKKSPATQGVKLCRMGTNGNNGHVATVSLFRALGRFRSEMVVVQDKDHGELFVLIDPVPLIEIAESGGYL